MDERRFKNGDDSLVISDLKNDFILKKPGNVRHTIFTNQKSLIHNLKSTGIRSFMVAGIIIMGIAAAVLEFNSGHTPDTFWYKTWLNASK